MSAFRPNSDIAAMVDLRRRAINRIWVPADDWSSITSLRLLNIPTDRIDGDAKSAASRGGGPPVWTRDTRPANVQLTDLRYNPSQWERLVVRLAGTLSDRCIAQQPAPLWEPANPARCVLAGTPGRSRKDPDQRSAPRCVRIHGRTGAIRPSARRRQPPRPTLRRTRPAAGTERIRPGAG